MPDSSDETLPAPRPTPGTDSRQTPRSRIPPDAVPGFALGRELGRGGMGVVFEATQLSLGRVVALKLILADDLASDSQADRFRREARAAARIGHPNIVQVHDFGDAGGRLWYALEFCPGGSLADRLRNGPMSVADARELVATLAEAVAAVHAEGVLHRDLKPDNVLFTAKGVPKVADFGLVRDPDGAGTRTGAVIGTPSYMPPEQARGEKVDARADVYALGAILYECLTGRPPYRGPNAMATLAMVLTWNPPPKPPSEVNRRVPAELDAACMRALHPEASRRFPSADAFAAALRGLARTNTAPTARVKPTRPRPLTPTEELPAAIRPRGGWSCGLLVLAMLAVVFLGIVAMVVLAYLYLAYTAKRTVPTQPAVALHPAQKPSPVVAPASASASGIAPMKWPCSSAEAQSAQAAWAAKLSVQTRRELALPNGERLPLMLVPPGTFQMGSPGVESGRADDEIRHEVTIPRPFWMGKTEVTQAQYKAVTGEDPSCHTLTGDCRGNVQGMDVRQFPVERVTWDEATAFCKRLPVAAMLPTEAQWEWACRAGTDTPFSFGKESNGTQSNCNGTSPVGTAVKGPHLQRACAVGSYSLYDNAFGLSDMHGNVAEWCQDRYAPYPAPTTPGSLDGPLGAGDPGGTERVHRGGSWADFYPDFCRSARRFKSTPGYRISSIGFRVCVAIE